MSDDYVECLELCGKTIKLVRLYRDDDGRTEMQMDLTNGTTFACSFCVESPFEAKLIRAGSSDIETLHTCYVK